MKKSFKSIRKFINIRNLCFFIFEICTFVLLILAALLISFIIIFSTKERVVKPLNSYVLQYINKNYDVNANFDVDNSTLHFDSSLCLKYNVKSFNMKSDKVSGTLSDTVVGFDFVKLLFGKIDIKGVLLNDVVLKVNLDKLGNEQSLSGETGATNVTVQDIVKTLKNNYISITNFKFDDIKLVVRLNGFDNRIDILKSFIAMNISGNNLKIKQDTTINVNKSKNNSRFKITCDSQNKVRDCDLDIENVNPNDFKTFFRKDENLYSYLSNLRGYFDLEFNFILDKSKNFKDGKGTIKSSDGEFYFKDFFDEKLIFKNLILNASFEDYFKNVSINSLTTDFDETHFFMSMFVKKEEDYKNIDLSFNIQNTPVTSLKKLWPNFLDNEVSRPWVLKHIKSGNLPVAKADMNFKLFDNNEDESGLQKIDAEVVLENVLLDYDEYFPNVKNINGKAVFTKDDMKVQIQSADVLRSKLSNGTVYIDFNKNPSDVMIQGNLKGPLADLFTHIDKNDESNIKNAVDSIMEDYYTVTDLNVVVPLVDDITFNKVFISTFSTIFNKKNSLLVEDSKLKLSFAKPFNSNEFFGNLNLSYANLEYLPLNILKPSGQKLTFDYICELNNGVVNIKDIESNADFIDFIASGFLNLEEKVNEINIENIHYNDSNFNVYYKSKIVNNVLINDIDIDGKNINYSNIINRLNNAKNIVTAGESKAKNETNVNLKLKYLGFENNKYLNSPVLSAHFENNNIKEINFGAKINEDEFIKIDFNKRKKMLNAKSNNFGTLFQIIGITNDIVGGDGQINFNQKVENGKSVIYGNIDIDKQFKIITDEQANKDLIPNIREEKYFKRLTKSLVEDSSIRFDKMRGNVKISGNVLTFDEIVANSSYISLQILASGFLNFNTKEIKINGLLMPLGMINGLFGANKLPIIADLVFGQKDAGLFASKFEVTKKNKNSKLDFKIDKFSMIMPGFLRNIF